MWLPKPVYESVPFCYLAIGAALLGGAFQLDTGRWTEACAGIGVVALVAGLVLILRRKGYRASRSRLGFDQR
jgi:hypothetical protein